VTKVWQSRISGALLIRGVGAGKDSDNVHVT
jgi:hypothetical protein